MNRILRGGIGSAAVKLANTALSFLLAVLLARILGPESYGVYGIAVALISLLAIPLHFGLARLTVREVARALASQEWSLLRGLRKWSMSLVAAASLVLAILVIAVISVLPSPPTEATLHTLAWGLLLIPLISVMKVVGGTLQGYERVVLGQLPEMVFRPGFQVLLVAAAIFAVHAEATSVMAMQTYVGATALSVFVALVLLQQRHPHALRKETADTYRKSDWLASILPLAIAAGLQQIIQHSGVLILGLFDSADQAGIYRVAVQGSLLVVLAQQAANMSLAPYFARLYHQEDYKALQRIVTLSARIVFLTGLPLVAIVAVWGEGILTMVIGSDYKMAHLAWFILACGHLCSGFCGSVGALLNMTGHERKTVRGMLLAAALNLVVNVLLVPKFGLEGAALSAALTVAVLNGYLSYSVYSALGIRSVAFHPTLHR